MDDLFKEAHIQTEAQNQSIDRYTGYLIFAGSLMDSRSLGKLLSIMEKEDESTLQESLKLRAILKLIREQQRRNAVKQLVLSVLLVLLTLLLITGMPTTAQDTPLATNIPETVESTATLVSSEPIVTPVPAATEAPTPVQLPVQAPGDNNLIYVVGFLILLAFSGFTQYLQHRQVKSLTDTVNIALSNKQVIDEGQRLYMESSLSVQNYVKLAQGLAVFFGTRIPGEDVAEKLAEFLGKVTAPPPPPGEIG